MLEKILKWISAVTMAILVMGCAASIREEAQPKEPDPIPRLYLEGRIDWMQEKEDVRKVSVEYRDGADSFRAYAQLKVQGASSLDYEKKNYTIKFFSDEEATSKKKVDLGWGKQNQYCLKANWVDKTHARNLVSARLAAQVQERCKVLPQAPNRGLVDGFPIEVYDNGEFLGLYTLNIPKDAWMLGMDKDNKNHLAFICYDWSPAAMFEELPTYDAWGIEVGEQNEENLRTLSRLFDFVIHSSDEEFRANHGAYFDLDAVLNYIILCEFGLMVDNSVKNMILATYDGKVWYPILYDMDSSWGTDWSGQELYFYELASITSTCDLLKRVKQVFPEELVTRYAQLRQDLLTKEHVMELFRDFEATVPPETREKELARWKVIPGFGYDQIEEFLDQRIPFLDENMLELLEAS